jgi:coenzyme F420 hydrogenase subunit beta
MSPALALLPTVEAGPSPLRGAPLRDLCTDCGLSRTREPSRCGRACQFIRPRYPELERQVHGRARDPRRPDELHFGPFLEMLRARRREVPEGAQWTGIATRIGERLLETGAVDAVLATASAPDDRWRPVPVIVTRPEDMAACRGMKMGFSPLLGLLDEAVAAGHRKLAVIGIPCQVHALRALEEELGLEALYVVGTPCSDNTTTEHFHRFLELLTPRPDEVTYLEFCTDYRVELRFRDGEVRRIPFLQLPISQLPDDFFPLTCRTCVDYANALADVTVGYMGGDGDQWLLVRNRRGRFLMSLVETELAFAPITSSGRREGPVRGFLANLERAAGGLPARRMPAWLRPLVARLQRSFGPKGLEFARARVEMKALECLVTLRQRRPRLLRRMVPDTVWKLAEPYGLVPVAGELEARRKECSW